MLASTIFLRDRNPKLINAWKEAFGDFDQIDVAGTDFFDQPADAMVSPANSFGIMDGGLDLLIRERIGGDIQHRVQDMILKNHYGEIPVGAAEIVPTGNEDYPYIVVAPTMRVPESVAWTLNAYLAFRASLLAVCRFNRDGGKIRINTLLVPGLGTGVGGMDPVRCAAQMRIAYNYVSRPARIPSFDEIHTIHRKLVLAT